MTITARIIADSISPEDIRLTTMELLYPRFIHAELMTHRAFSRNASSSRATPVARLIKNIQEDPAMPVWWGANQPGMQARAELGEQEKENAKLFWHQAKNAALKYADLMDHEGAHKQIVNRLLEPFSHIKVIVTATEWDNFYQLRRHADAQPEFKVLADAMWQAQEESTPSLVRVDDWHVPYFDKETEVNLLPTRPESGDWFTQLMIKISVARCARVSYLTHEGKKPSVASDLELYVRLMGSVPIHASPAEHQATPDTSNHGHWVHPGEHGNLRGWRQYRQMI